MTFAHQLSLGGVDPARIDRSLLLQRDAVELMRSLPSESIDCIITDPAYESLEKHRAVGTTTRLTGEWFDIFPNARFADFFLEAHRVLAKSAHLYMYCDQETMFEAKPIAERMGFRFWKAIVWDKCTIGMGYHYRSRHEVILFFEKGKRRLHDLGVPDVLVCDRVHGGYPTEKPTAVSRVLIRQSTDSGQVVLDPFMGSGSVGVAAVSIGRRFLGGDTSARAIALADERLQTQPLEDCDDSALSWRRPR